ncbi:MAG: hypothetical protein M0Q95_13310 [Porticoccaceae bacterium]|nr:hypothetical protein [Porticoccaceae bacterium]
MPEKSVPDNALCLSHNNVEEHKSANRSCVPPAAAAIKRLVMDFQKHPSAQLSSLFSSKPWQGQNPGLARVIILSSDANYAPEISNHPFFQYILEYQRDGVSFWKKYGVHHPFLLDSFPFNKTGHGRPYHNNIRKLGLNASYADKISFLELLDIPTIGNKSEDRKQFYSLVSGQHLRSIDNLIKNDSGRLFLVPGGVLEDMLYLKKRYPVFPWLTSIENEYSINSNRIIKIYHFSSSHIHRQLTDIRTTIDMWIKNRSIASPEQ